MGIDRGAGWVNIGLDQWAAHRNHQGIDHPHFAEKPPVSTGREVFSAAYLDSVLTIVDPVEPGDLMATLTELTAASIAGPLVLPTPSTQLVRRLLIRTAVAGRTP